MTYRSLRQSDVMKCPHYILLPTHYRANGKCRCDDPTHLEMKAWGYHWDGSKWTSPSTEEEE